MSWQDFITAPAETAPTPSAQPSGEWRGFASAPAEAPPAAKRPVSVIPPMDVVNNWLTFGLANKADALGAAVGASLPGSANPGGFWDTYARRLDQLRQQSKDYMDAHPIANLTGTIAGGLAGAPAAAGARVATGLGNAIVNAAKGGAVVGAASGAGSAEPGQELSGAAEGAIGGGALGAAIPPLAQAARPLLEGFQQMIPSLFPQAAWNAALNRIAQRVQQSEAAGGPGIAEMRAGLVPGKPMGLVDVGGAPVQGLAGTLGRTPGESSEIARKFFSTRDADAGSRLIADIDARISSGSDAPDAIAALFKQRATAAAPLYEKAFATQGPVISDRLQQFLDDPILRQGLAKGVQIQRLESLATGKPFSPNDYTMSYDFAPTSHAFTNGVPPQLEGVPRFTPTPNMRTLDAAKRGLDDIVEQYRDPTTGKLVLDQYGRAVNQVRAAFVKELDNLNPDYAAARAAWSGPSDAIDLIRRGQAFQSARPEDLARSVSQMTPQERELYLLGVADKLRTNVQQTAINGDEAKRLINSQYVQNQLRPLFANQSDYDNFIRSVMAERNMFEIKTPIVGGSQTAARLAEDAAGHNEGGTMMKLAAGALAAKGGEPFLGASMLLRGAKEAYGHLTQPSARVNETMARMLFNPDQQANMEVLNALAARRPQMLAPPWLIAPGARLMGSIAPPLLSGGGGLP